MSIAVHSSQSVLVLAGGHVGGRPAL